MFETIKTLPIQAFHFACSLTSPNKIKVWLPEQLWCHPNQYQDFLSKESPLHCHAVRAYSENTVRDVITSPRLSWIKGTCSTFISKTICVASFHLTSNSNLHAFAARIGAFFYKSANTVAAAALPVPTTLLKRLSFIDISPLILFTAGTAFRLTHIATNYKYPILYQLSNLTDRFSNAIEVAFWVRVVAVCAFNSVPGVLAIALLAGCIFTGAHANPGAVDSLVASALSSLPYIVATLFAYKVTKNAFHNMGQPNLVEIQKTLDQIREIKIESEDSSEFEKLHSEIKQKTSQLVISHSDYEAFTYQICDKATKYCLKMTNGPAREKLKDFINKNSVHHSRIIHMIFAYYEIIILFPANTPDFCVINSIKSVIGEETALAKPLRAIIDPERLNLFIAYKDSAFEGYSETKMGNKSWEMLTLDEQIDLAQQYLRENPLSIFYSFGDVRHPDFDKCRNKEEEYEDEESFVKALEFFYYVSKYQAFCKGYTIKQAQELADPVSCGLTRFAEYKQLADIAKERNIKNPFE
ncbi:MAG: hypothetical protein WC222_10330 [Parachlamydiales bacterium]|jgi:hypothetical protein